MAVPAVVALMVANLAQALRQLLDKLTLLGVKEIPAELATAWEVRLAAVVTVLPVLRLWLQLMAETVAVALPSIMSVMLAAVLAAVLTTQHNPEARQPMAAVLAVAVARLLLLELLELPILVVVVAAAVLTLTVA
jgi:hypothetical protein